MKTTSMLSAENLKVIENFVEKHPWISFLAKDKSKNAC